MPKISSEKVRIANFLTVRQNKTMGKKIKIRPVEMRELGKEWHLSSHQIS